MGSPPEPWERAGPTTSLPDPTPTLSASGTTSAAPVVPAQPGSIASSVSQPPTSLSPYFTNAYSLYSPYSRFGSYGTYGGYGGGMYGSGMYGQPMGMGTTPGGMNPYNLSPTQSVMASTQHAVGLLGHDIGTFTLFARVLNTSFMATQSSIFAILGVADQLSQLRENGSKNSIRLLKVLKWEN